MVQNKDIYIWGAGHCGVCEHDKITVLNHEELAKSGIKTDAAILLAIYYYIFPNDVF